MKTSRLDWKKIFHLEITSFFLCLHNERMFIHIYIHLDNGVTSGESNYPSDFVTQIFLDSRLQYESLEGLMDFLAFLVQKLWQNKQKLIREIPRNYSAMSSMIWDLLALTWAPETLGSRSRHLQLHTPA